MEATSSEEASFNSPDISYFIPNPTTRKIMKSRKGATEESVPFKITREKVLKTGAKQHIEISNKFQMFNDSEDDDEILLMPRYY